MEIDVQGVKITLTKEQLKEIQKQTEENIFTATTYKEVCKRLNQSIILEDFFKFDKRLAAFAKIKQLEEYFNQGWKPDWKKDNEYKYYPHFKYSFGRFCFCYSSYRSYHFPGQPGYFRNAEISNHVRKYFNDIYEDLT